MASSSSHRSSSPDPLPNFKTEFHPRSRRAPLYHAQEELSQRDVPELAPDSRPWRPFVEKGDCLFAEIALQAGLNASYVNSLLTLITRIPQGKLKVTLRNETDLRCAWDRAAMQVTQVSIHHSLSQVFPEPESMYSSQLYF